MKLFILDETFDLKNEMESVERIFDYIAQALEETEYNFNHIIVDGEEIYDEFEVFLVDNIFNIEEVKIVMMTNSEVVKDSFKKIGEYLELAIPIIGNLAHNFRIQPKESDLKILRDLFEGVEFIFHTRESIDNMESLNKVVSNQSVWNEYKEEVKELDSIVKELKIAMDNTGMNLISDLLSQKLIQLFEKMKIKLHVLSS